jgi:hypothetical protein
MLRPSARQSHTAGGHVPRIAVGEQLAFADQGSNTRPQHQVADLPVGLEVVCHRVADNAGDLPPFRGRSFDQKRIKVVDRCRNQTRWRHDTKGRVLHSQPAPVPTGFFPLLGCDGPFGPEQRPQSIRQNQRDRGRSRSRNVDYVIRSIAKPVSHGQKECEFPRGVASEPDNESVIGCRDTVPERLEVILTLRHVI